jgi:predicted esterase
MSSSTPKIYFERLGERGGPVFWGHGWGQNHAAFMPMVRSLEGMGQQLGARFSGFWSKPPAAF